MVKLLGRNAYNNETQHSKTVEAGYETTGRENGRKPKESE